MIAIANTINSTVIRGGAVSLLPFADFSSSLTTVPDEGTIDFYDQSTVPPSAPPITSWSWTFAGGTPNTSTAQNPTGIQYNTPGTYDVSLEVTNAEGSNTKTTVGYITVVDAQIVADFTVDNQSPTEGDTVQFTDASYGDTAEAWNWSFPGGTPATSTLQNPTVTYNTPGDYDVTLEVFDETTSDTTTKTNFISVQVVPVVANFSASPTQPTEGDTVTFTDTSTGTPTSWSWSFPGGTPSTSSAQNPSVQYNTIGNYSVSLDASKPGSTDNETKANYIQVQSGETVQVIDSFKFGFGGFEYEESTTIQSFEFAFSGFDEQIPAT